MTAENNIIREKIIKGLNLSSIRLLKNKRDRNLRIVISENGKIVEIDPKDIK
jgi:hypothetical protein